MGGPIVQFGTVTCSQLGLSWGKYAVHTEAAPEEDFVDHDGGCGVRGTGKENRRNKDL